MGDLRDKLGRLFDPVEPIAHDEVEPTSPRRRRRRRRRRSMLAVGGATAVTAGIVAVVLMGGAATTNVTVGSSSTQPPVYPTSTTSTAAGVGTGVVPWADEPATAPPAPPQPNPPAPAYPACHASQLTAARNSAVAATSHYLRSLEVTNTSGSDCSLSGYPTSLIGIHPDGTQQLLTPGHDGFFEQNFAWPANLHPAQSATVGIATSSGCPTAGQSQPAVTAYAGEILGVPGGGTIRASAPFNAVCGVSLTTFGRPEPSSAQTAQPQTGSYPGLSVRADLPSHVVAGTVMDYTVTLTNSTDRPVALDPCPVYQETIAAIPLDQHTYRLNCSAIPAIPAEGSVTYAMRIPVPDTPAGPTKFNWTIPNSQSTDTGTVITISPRS